MPALVRRTRTFCDLVVCLKSWCFLMSLLEIVATATSRFPGFAIHLWQLLCPERILPQFPFYPMSVSPSIVLVGCWPYWCIGLVLFEMRYLHDEFQFVRFGFRKNGYSKQHICQALNQPRNSLCPERVLPHFAFYLMSICPSFTLIGFCSGTTSSLFAYCRGKFYLWSERVAMWLGILGMYSISSVCVADARAFIE